MRSKHLNLLRFHVFLHYFTPTLWRALHVYIHTATATFTFTALSALYPHPPPDNKCPPLSRNNHSKTRFRPRQSSHIISKLNRTEQIRAVWKSLLNPKRKRVDLHKFSLWALGISPTSTHMYMLVYVCLYMYTYIFIYLVILKVYSAIFGSPFKSHTLSHLCWNSWNMNKTKYMRTKMNCNKISFFNTFVY